MKNVWIMAAALVLGAAGYTIAQSPGGQTVVMGPGVGQGMAMMGATTTPETPKQ